MNRKKVFLIAFISLFIIIGCGSVKAKTPIKQAFDKISQQDGFQNVPTDLIKERFPMFDGEIVGVIYGNAEPHDKVLDILRIIPQCQLYYEILRGKNNMKIERYYIAEDSKGNDQMLYSFTGINGNDLVVFMFTDAPKGQYKREIDKIKQSNNY